MRQTLFLLSVAAVAAVAGSPFLQASQRREAQQPPASSAGVQRDVPTFRSSVQWVDVDAVVRDRHGKFVAGLTKDDFEVYEDGTRQNIEKLTFVDLPPVDASAPRPASSAILGNLPENAGRIYALVLADSRDSARVREIATTFIERFLGPNDLMAVINVFSVGSQELTNDRERLLGAVSQYMPPDSRMPLLDVIRRTYRSLKDVAVSMGAVTGRRKNIIFVSEGVNLWVTPAPWNMPANRFSSAPPALMPRDEEELSFDHVPELWRIVTDATRTAAALNVPVHTVSPTPRLLMAYRTLKQQDHDSGLRLVSEDTGGIDLVNATDLPKGFRQIVDVNSRYYVLGYYSSAERNTDYHRIAIRVRRPDVYVDSRKGFRAVPPQRKWKNAKLPRGLEAAATSSLRGRLTASAIEVDASATIFRGDVDGGSILVSATIDAHDLDLSNGKRLQVSAAAVDDAGHTVGADGRSFTFALRPATRARVEDHGLHFFARVPAPRGPHTVRVVVHQPGGPTGLSTIHVDVPDFTDGTLFFSDMVLTNRQPRSLTLVGDLILKRALPGAPIPERTFAQGDTVSVYAEIYNGQWLLASSVGIKWSVVDDAGAVLMDGEQTVSLSSQRGQFRGSIPTTNLSPGSYTVNIEASALTGPPAFARQQAQFDLTAD